MRTRPKAFTIIELLIAVTIVGILAGLVISNYARTKVRAADTNIKESVRAYRQALELHYAQGKTYFVTMPGASCATTFDAARLGGYQLVGTGAGCTGFNGGSMGRITRKDVQVRDSGGTLKGSYGASIADALVAEGVLSSVQTYPGVKDFTSYDPSGDTVDDFILSLCDKDGYQAKDAASAVNFAVLAKLKSQPDPTDATRVQANRYCGGKNTGTGWNLIDVTQ